MDLEIQVLILNMKLVTIELSLAKNVWLTRILESVESDAYDHEGDIFACAFVGALASCRVESLMSLVVLIYTV